MPDAKCHANLPDRGKSGRNCKTRLFLFAAGTSRTPTRRTASSSSTTRPARSPLRNSRHRQALSILSRVAPVFHARNFLLSPVHLAQRPLKQAAFLSRELMCFLFKTTSRDIKHSTGSIIQVVGKAGYAGSSFMALRKMLKGEVEKCLGVAVN